MKILFYSVKRFEKPFLEQFAPSIAELSFLEESLSIHTVDKAGGFDVISIFTGDDASAAVIRELKKQGVGMIAVRAAGYDNVDIEAANKAEITVANVPEYSPYAIAEHATAMILALNRKLVLADRQVHRQDFTLDNLVGMDLNRKTVGIIGTGRIGSAFARIMHGFGCTLMGYDVHQNEELQTKYGMYYVGLNALCSMADVISIHVPLHNETRHLVNDGLLGQMKKGVILVNTSRGAVVDTADVLKHLESGHLGAYGMDVYEHEKGIFFHDRQGEQIKDPMLKKLLSLSNVLVTPHQAFATKEALSNIAETTFYNINSWESWATSGNELTTVKETRSAGKVASGQ